MRHVQVLNRHPVVAKRAIDATNARVRRPALAWQIQAPRGFQHIAKMGQGFVAAPQARGNVAHLVQGLDAQQRIIAVE